MNQIGALAIFFLALGQAAPPTASGWVWTVQAADVSTHRVLATYKNLDAGDHKLDDLTVKSFKGEPISLSCDINVMPFSSAPASGGWGQSQGAILSCFARPTGLMVASAATRSRLLVNGRPLDTSAYVDLVIQNVSFIVTTQESP